MNNAVRQSITTARSQAARLSGSEIDTLLDRLARGHLSTFQEEYADLKQALVPL